MAYCRNCGTPISDQAAVCPHCGSAQTTPQTPPPVVDNGGFLWGLLGCCIPIVGLILYLVWKDMKPNTARAVGIGALVSVGIAVLNYVLIFALGLGLSVFSFGILG